MQKGRTFLGWTLRLAALALALRVGPALPEPASSLGSLFEAGDIIVLGDVKHGTAARVRFFSSERFFEAMARSGVRQVAIEMPRVLGRQAMGIETVEDIEAFASDVMRSERWHFTDPDHPEVEDPATQRAVASALGTQVLLAKRYGLNPIFYDFNNPLGGFTSFHDPVYRCLANLTSATFVRYALADEVTKPIRDSAIVRERFSHDDELATYIAEGWARAGGGKLVVIPGYAHAVMEGGLTDQLEARIGRKAIVAAVFADDEERNRFPSFLWEQSMLLQINLSRAPHFFYTIADDTLRAEPNGARFASIDGTGNLQVPSICVQWTHLDLNARPQMLTTLRD